MYDHSPDFSIEQAKKLANSPTGQQLLKMLQQADEAKLQKVMQQVSSGDLEGAKAAVSQLLSSEQGQKLLQKLEE